MIRRVGALFLAGVATAMAQDGRVPAEKRGAELVEKALMAMGGAPAVDSVKSLELKGKGTRRLQGNDLAVGTISRYVFPDRYYQEIVLPMGTMKTVLGSKEAFIVAGEGSLPLPDSERHSLLKVMRRNLVFVLQGRGHPLFTARVVGTATVEGHAAEQVKITNGSDDMILAIDPASGRVLQATAESGGGATPVGTLVITYSDYRKAGPIVYPYKAVGTFAGQPAFTSQLDSVVVNPTLDEALFQPPPPHSMFPGAEEQPLPPVPPAPSPAPPQATPAPAKPSPTPPPGE
jgi:hypothetical protein